MNTPLRVLTKLDEAVHEALLDAGFDPVTYRWALAVETVEGDTQHQMSLLSAADLDPTEAVCLTVDVARRVGVSHGLTIGYRCICGGNSPTPQCPDFPDCLPGGGS